MKKFVAILAIFGALFLGAMDLQTASKSELMEIKGVGEKKADAIIEYRKTNTIKSAEDLKNIKGFGDTIIDNVKNNVKAKSNPSKKDEKNKSKDEDNKESKKNKNSKSENWYIFQKRASSWLFNKQIIKTLFVIVMKQFLQIQKMAMSTWLFGKKRKNLCFVTLAT